jgi:endonuclease G
MLENAIRRQALRDEEITRLCVFAGPVFDDRRDLVCDDRDGKVLIPTAFWKVVVAPSQDGGIRAYGFITSQKKDLADDPPFEDFSPAGFEDSQATLAEIERRTIVRFAARLKAADVMHDHPSHPEIAPLARLDDLWLGRR